MPFCFGQYTRAIVQLRMINSGLFYQLGASRRCISFLLALVRSDLLMMSLFPAATFASDCNGSQTIAGRLTKALEGVLQTVVHHPRSPLQTFKQHIW